MVLIKAKQTFLNPNRGIKVAYPAFGTAVGLDGNNVVIGDRTGLGDGAAFLFDATTGELRQRYYYPGLSAGDMFGTAVAIDGNQVLIGGRRDRQFNGGGAAFLFDTNTGNLIRTFSLPDTTVLGFSVALDANQALLGDSQNRTVYELGGAAFLFDTNTGNKSQSFFSPNPAPPQFNVGDSFGQSVAISDNKVLIGAGGDQTFGYWTGAAYLFEGTNGNLLQKFFSPSPKSESAFGAQVAIDGNNVLISDFWKDTFIPNSGAVYLFDATSGNLLHTFFAPNPQFRQNFGSSIAIEGNKVLISAWGDDTYATDSGAAFLFDAKSGILIDSFYNPNPSNEDNFGLSVDISGNDLLIGAPGAGEGDSGATFLFETVQEIFLGTNNPDTLTGTSAADFIAGLSGEDIINGADGNDRLHGNQGNDTITGGNGDDLIRGGRDNDQLFGNTGNDSILGDLGNDVAFGGDGDDYFEGGSGDDILAGELGNDTLLGIDGNDSLNGNKANDFINGNQGNDTIIGGDGGDILRGGKDNDLIFGDAGNDFLYGDRGTDTLTGAIGNDTFFLTKNVGSTTLTEADIVTDFVDGSDLLGLIAGLKFEDLNIFQGIDVNQANTIIQDKSTNQFLAVLQGVNHSTIDVNDFTQTEPIFG